MKKLFDWVGYCRSLAPGAQSSKSSNQQLVRVFTRSRQHPTQSIFLISLILFSIFNLTGCGGKPQETQFKEFTVTTGTVQKVAQANGVIEPKNKVQILPPVSGRIEELRVDEGQSVYKGQIMAMMSSTDRAALIDAARTRGGSDLANWESIYKPIPILAPVSGKVILRNIVTGQTISATSVLFEVSDILVVNAYVDETDIALIGIGQSVKIVVDAYSNQPLSGKVLRIKQSSQLVNNVNVYPVQVGILKPPAFLRSGMTASLEFKIKEKANVAVLPVFVLEGKENSELEVLVKRESQNQKTKIKTGIADDKNIEIISGLKVNEVVLIKQNLNNTNSQGTSGPFGQRRSPRGPR